MIKAISFAQELREKGQLAPWQIIEIVKRMLHGQELTVQEADEIHALVRQNTIRKRG